MIISVKKINLDGEFDHYKMTLIDGIVWDVPPVEDNRHYQDILKWEAEGNVIEEAD